MFVRDEDNHLQTEDAAKASTLANQGELAMSDYNRLRALAAELEAWADGDKNVDDDNHIEAVRSAVRIIMRVASHTADIDCILNARPKKEEA